MDETRWMVFVEIEGKTGYRWWLWVVVTQQTVCYLVDPSRSSEVPRALLEGAQGILNVDRYSAYKTLALEEKGIQLAFCWAHVRRDFDGAATKHDKLKGWAEAWIDGIGLAYKLNDERLEVYQKDEEAFARRDRVLRQAMDNLKEQAKRELADPGLHEEQKKVLTSLLNHWQGLTVFLDHPDVPMDNNVAELHLRNPVVGRKNYYGSGAEWSGHLSACLFTILATLQRNRVNPRHYLEVYFETCAANEGKPLENIEAYQPWDLSQEVREAIERKAQQPGIPP
jgi:transposase